MFVFMWVVVSVWLVFLLLGTSANDDAVSVLFGWGSIFIWVIRLRLMFLMMVSELECEDIVLFLMEEVMLLVEEGMLLT